MPKGGGQKPVSRCKGNSKRKKSEDITITKPLITAPVVCTTSFTSTEKSVPLHDNHTIGTSNHSSLLMPPSSCSSSSSEMPQSEPSPMSGHGNFARFGAIYPGCQLQSPIPQTYPMSYKLIQCHLLIQVIHLILCKYESSFIM